MKNILSTKASTKNFFACSSAILLFSFHAFAGQISSAASGNWNTAATWSPASVPTASDTVTILSGHSITMDANPGACARLIINKVLQWSAILGSGTLNVGAGGLVLAGGSSVGGNAVGTLNVSGDCSTTGSGVIQIGRPSFIIAGTTTIISGTTLEFILATGTKTFNNLIIQGTYQNTGNVNFAINGNLQNDGSYNGGTTGKLTFGGSSSSTITGTSSTPFNAGFTLNKGTSSATVLDAQSVISLAAGAIVTLTNGTLKLSNAGTSITPFNADIASPPYLIPSTAGLWCNGATINTGVNMNWTIAGLLRSSAGTIKVGSVSDNNLQVANGSTSQITVDGGNLLVAGRITRLNASSYIKLSVSSGTFTLPAAGTTSVPFQIDNVNDTVTMTGGTLAIERAGVTNSGVSISAGKISLTGGTIQFGDASTPASQIMQLNSSSPVFNLSVNSANATGQLAVNTTVNGAVTISAGTLDANAFNITLAGNWTNNATYTHNTGNITFSGTTAITGTVVSTFNSVTITGTLTGSSGNINVQKNWTNNGIFNNNSGTITFNGTTAQTIGGTAITDFYNITQSNSAGVSLTGAQNLVNILTISSGTFTTTGFNFTLKSTAANTARIAAIPSGVANFTGNIIIERYTTGPTQWRNLGSAVSAATIFDWTDNFATSGFTGATCNPSNCASPGCAATCTYVSVYTYDETVLGVNTNGYVAAANVTDPLTVGKGFFVYLGPNPVTFNVPGSPNKFSQSLPVSYTSTPLVDDDGWNLVSNPYPCAIDWDNVNWTKTNINDAVYVFNSNGNYASYIAGVGTNGGTRYLASQQGFWVKANAASPALSVVEDVKTSTVNPTFLRTSSFSFGEGGGWKASPNTSPTEPAFRDFPVPHFTNNLPNSIMFTASGNGKQDEMFIQFLQGATDTFDSGYDAYDLTNDIGVPNLSSLSADNKDLSINRMSALTGNVSVPIRLRVAVADTYSLRRDSILNLPLSSCVTLEDLATGNWIDLKQNISYSFYISDTTLAPRFILHINNSLTKQTFSASCATSSNGMAIALGTLAGPWTYTWKDSIGNILQTHTSSAADTLFTSQGIYTVEVNSTACGMASDTFVITAPPLLTMSAVYNNVSCNGLSDGSAAVTPLGGTPPYVYMWSNGATTSQVTNLTSQVYSVTVTDNNGCIVVSSGFIDVPVHSVFTVNKDTLYVNFNDTAHFTNSSTGATNYQWNFGDGSPLNTSFAPSHFYANTGTYTVTLIAWDNNLCHDTAYYSVVVFNTTSTPNSQLPTPNSVEVLYDENGGVFLQFNLDKITAVTISVFNIIGEKVESQYLASVKNEKVKIPLKSVSKGMYFVVAASNLGTGGWVITKKISR